MFYIALLSQASAHLPSPTLHPPIGQAPTPTLLRPAAASASSSSPSRRPSTATGAAVVDWTGPGGLQATLGQLWGSSPVTPASGEAGASFWLELHAKARFFFFFILFIFLFFFYLKLV